MRNNEIFEYTWNLVQALQLASPAFCKTPFTFIDSIYQNNQPGKNKLYCFGLSTQCPGLKEVDLESSHKKGCDMISIMKQGRNTQKKVCHTARTHIWIRALREVDLEPSAKRGTNRTRALVNLYRSSWRLHLKQSPNQISHKPTK